MALFHLAYLHRIWLCKTQYLVLHNKYWKQDSIIIVKQGYIQDFPWGTVILFGGDQL